MDFPYGEITNNPPKNFAPPESWPEYSAIADPPSFCSREFVGKEPLGARWSVWPLTFEEYASDKEPDLSESKKGALARNRLITWKRLTRRDTPPGWREGKVPWRIDGYHPLSPSGDYTALWHKNAQREVTLWRGLVLEKKYIIEEIPFVEFKTAYKKSTIAKKVGLGFLGALERRLAYPQTSKNCTLWGVRNTQSGEIIAGVAALYSPSYSASVRECPFILAEAKKVFASVGLIDHWFKESQRRGIALLHFSAFWHSGEPQSLQGASEFKSHFGLTYVAYPPLLTRIVFGKFL